MTKEKILEAMKTGEGLEEVMEFFQVKEIDSLRIAYEKYDEYDLKKLKEKLQWKEEYKRLISLLFNLVEEGKSYYDLPPIFKKVKEVNLLKQVIWSLKGTMDSEYFTIQMALRVQDESLHLWAVHIVENYAAQIGFIHLDKLFEDTAYLEVKRRIFKIFLEKGDIDLLCAAFGKQSDAVQKELLSMATSENLVVLIDYIQDRQLQRKVFESLDVSDMQIYLSTCDEHSSKECVRYAVRQLKNEEIPIPDVAKQIVA